MVENHKEYHVYIYSKYGGRGTVGRYISERCPSLDRLEDRRWWRITEDTTSIYTVSRGWVGQGIGTYLEDVLD